MSGNRDNSGTVSKNATKEQPNHADIKGSAVIDGVSYWISGWQKSNERGTYYSLAFKPKDGQAERPTGLPQAPHKAPVLPDDDSIPF